MHSTSQILSKGNADLQLRPPNCYPIDGRYIVHTCTRIWSTRELSQVLQRRHHGSQHPKITEGKDCSGNFQFIRPVATELKKEWKRQEGERIYTLAESDLSSAWNVPPSLSSWLRYRPVKLTTNSVSRYERQTEPTPTFFTRYLKYQHGYLTSWKKFRMEKHITSKARNQIIPVL